MDICHAWKNHPVYWCQQYYSIDNIVIKYFSFCAKDLHTFILISLTSSAKLFSLPDFRARKLQSILISANNCLLLWTKMKNLYFWLGFQTAALIIAFIQTLWFKQFQKTKGLAKTLQNAQYTSLFGTCLSQYGLPAWNPFYQCERLAKAIISWLYYEVIYEALLSWEQSFIYMRVKYFIVPGGIFVTAVQLPGTRVQILSLDRFF